MILLRARSLASFLVWLSACMFAFTPASAQVNSPIPSDHIRVHYFRPDGNYTGWTIYAFFDTTEPNNFQAGPVSAAGTDGFGAYFDVGVTPNAQNVGLILHKGDTKDPGPNQYVDPATQGREFWEISGSDTFLTYQPALPTQGQAPPIPPNHARIHYYRPDNTYNNWLYMCTGRPLIRTAAFARPTIPTPAMTTMGRISM